MNDDRPTSIEEMLDKVADFLDLGDELIEVLTTKLGDPMVLGNEVQTDVRRLADIIGQAPWLDKALYNALYES
jgi:hypothetical protein